MSLQAQLMEEMKQAMRDRDTVKLGVIRFLRSEIKNYEIDHGQQDDEGVLKVIASQVKKIKESIEEYKKGGREDLVEEETAKLKILETYLPAQMPQEELEEIIKEVLAQNEGAQMGPIIGQVMAKVRGQADGGRVSQLVKKLMA